MIAVWVFIGGGIGSLLRYGISLLVMSYKTTHLPIATFIANILSCLILGIALHYFAPKLQIPEVKAFLIIGLCGGFSTFSTFSLETLELIKTNNYPVAIANIVLSIGLCLGMLYWFGILKK